MEWILAVAESCCEYATEHLVSQKCGKFQKNFQVESSVDYTTESTGDSIFFRLKVLLRVPLKFLLVLLI